MEISLAPVTERDILELLSDLLPADRQEILAMGFEPEWAVRNSVATSLECVAFRGDGRLVCLTGVCEPLALDPKVYPWLLGTSLMLRLPRKVLVYSRKILDRWLSSHPYMCNYVDERHERAIRWLSWLGADLTLEPSFGPYSRPFYKFEFGELPCA